MHIQSGNSTLQGELRVPPQASGVVLFVHGSGSSRFSPRNQYVAHALNEAGIGTLLFDLLTAEEEAIDVNTREFRFNIELLTGRLLDATHWVGGRADMGRLKIGYFGASTGGAAALAAAARAKGVISAIVSRGGRPDLAGDALAEVDCPTLLIVGGKDEQVIQLNEQALAHLNCVKELRLVRGATHLFEEHGALKTVAELATDWFNRYLR